ncbi:MAG: DUF6088 family protein [Actinomycetota bacterium]
MSRGSGSLNRGGRPSAAAVVRRRIERGGDRFWRVRDFADLSPSAVARTLARLAEEGLLERPRRGLYYRPRETRFGMSIPSAAAVAAESLRVPVQPAGLTAASVLGFTTQNPALSELATPANNPPTAILPAKVKTRRPEARLRLSEREGALLELLRDRASSSDLSFDETHQRLLSLLAKGETFAKLARAALHEPPRVRAMLGALGQELGADERTLSRLRGGINPLSRYDFGRLGPLPYAREWQAQ